MVLLLLLPALSFLGSIIHLIIHLAHDIIAVGMPSKFSILCAVLFAIIAFVSIAPSD